MGSASALASGAFYRARAGAGCELPPDRRFRRDLVIADTGCTDTLLTPGFSAFVVAEHQGEKVVQLAGFRKPVVVEKTFTVELPVTDVDGKDRIAVERAIITPEARLPLLACARRPIELGAGGSGRVQMTDRDGSTFWAEAKLSLGLPSVPLQLSEVRACCAYASTSATALATAAQGGGVGERLLMLRALHYRYAHAVGERLHATLLEKGIETYTRQECEQVRDACDACVHINPRRRRVPPTADPIRGDLAYGDLIYQDLTQLPPSIGGCRFASIIVDAATRRVSAMAICAKSQAVEHLIEYAMKVEAGGVRVREVRTDNGGEFVGADYQNFCVKAGIAHRTGAPYTPQSQALVERANGTFKRLLGKVLRTCRLPVSVWVGLLPGVVQSLNDTVHSVIRMSPLAKQYGSQSGVIPLMCGDTVRVVDPRTGPPAVTGIFGGVLSPQCVSIVARAKDGVGWRILRVHPSAVTLVSWQGLGGGGSTPDSNPPLGGSTGVGGETYEAFDDDEDAVSVGGDLAAAEPTPAARHAAPSAHEPPPAPPDGAPREDRLVIANDSFILARSPEGAVFPAQVLKAGKRSLKVSVLQKSADIEFNHLQEIKRDTVLETFNLDKDGKIPAEVIARLCGSPQESAAADRVGGGGGLGVTDESAGDSGGDALADIPPMVEDSVSAGDDAESVDVQLALAVASRRPDGENQAKGHLDVTPEELRAGSHDAAMLKELERWVELKVLSAEVPRSPGSRERFMTTRWRHTWKATEEGGRKAKSRLVARGFQDPRDPGWVETYSGTAEVGQFRTALIYALCQGWAGAKADVKTAFLQAEATDGLLLRLPNELPPGADKLGFRPGAFHRQQKAVYGTMDAAKLFTDKFKAKSGELGWREIAQSVLVKGGESGGATRAILIMHIDDLLCLAADPLALISEIGTVFELDEPVMMKPGVKRTYVGMDIEFGEAGRVCRVGQDSYAEAIDTGLSVKALKRAVGPEDLQPAEAREIDERLQPQQRKWVGMLGWLAKTQPHLSVAFGEVARNSCKPSEQTVHAAKRLCEYAKATHKPLVFNGFVNDPVLVVWVDASFCVRRCEGRLGYEIQLVDSGMVRNCLDALTRDNLLAWRSLRTDRKMASTTAAELLALREGVKVVPLYAAVIQELWGVAPKEIYLTDSQPLLGWLQSRWVSTDPEWQGCLDYVVERLRERSADVRWVPTKVQRADRQTKFLRI